MTPRDYRIAHPTVSAARPTPNTMQITNDAGLTFCVRMVFQGDSYGLNNCMDNDRLEPLVEFYDTRYPHTEFGQFVSSYGAATFLEPHKQGRGLNLEGGVPDWGIDYDTLLEAQAWVQKKCDEVPGCLATPDHGTFVLTL